MGDAQTNDALPAIYVEHEARFRAVETYHPPRDGQAFVAGQLSDATMRAYASDLRAFQRWLHARGLDFFDGVTRDVVVDYRNWMKREAQDGRGYAHATIARRLSCLRQFYDHALGDGLVARNPAELVKTYRVSDESPRTPLTNAQVRALLHAPDRATVTGARDFALLVLMLFLGLRREEVVKLTGASVRVERDYTVLRVIGKGDKERKLPMKPFVVEALRGYLTLAGRADVLGVADDPLFLPTRDRTTGSNAHTLSTNRVWQIVRGYADVAGIERIDPHTLRLTAATVASEAGADAFRLRDFMGHSDVKTTQRYIKLRDNLENNAAWRVNYDA